MTSLAEVASLLTKTVRIEDACKPCDRIAEYDGFQQPEPGYDAELLSCYMVIAYTATQATPPVHITFVPVHIPVQSPDPLQPSPSNLAKLKGY